MFSPSFLPLVLFLAMKLRARALYNGQRAFFLWWLALIHIEVPSSLSFGSWEVLWRLSDRLEYSIDHFHFCEETREGNLDSIHNSFLMSKSGSDYNTSGQASNLSKSTQSADQRKSAAPATASTVPGAVHIFFLLSSVGSSVSVVLSRWICQ